MYEYEKRNDFYDSSSGMGMLGNYGSTTRSMLGQSGMSDDAILGSAVLAVAFFLGLLLSAITGICVGLSEPVRQLTFSTMLWAAIALGAGRAFVSGFVVSFKAGEINVPPSMVIWGQIITLALTCGLAGLLSIWWPMAGHCCLAISGVASLVAIITLLIHVLPNLKCNAIIMILYYVLSGVALYQVALHAA
ncbi:MAG: hypothetical protein ACYS30_23045 [Planctomycetota bacterium]